MGLYLHHWTEQTDNTTKQNFGPEIVKHREKAFKHWAWQYFFGYDIKSTKKNTYYVWLYQTKKSLHNKVNN